MAPNQGPEQCRLEGPQGQLSIEDTASSPFLSKAVSYCAFANRVRCGEVGTQSERPFKF